MIVSMSILDSSRRRVISLNLPSRPLTLICASFSPVFPNFVLRFHTYQAAIQRELFLRVPLSIYSSMMYYIWNRTIPSFRYSRICRMFPGAFHDTVVECETRDITLVTAYPTLVASNSLAAIPQGFLIFHGPGLGHTSPVA